MSSADSMESKQVAEVQLQPAQGHPSWLEAEKDVNATAPEQVFDRGWHAWGTFLGGFIVFFVTFGYSNAFGVYQDYYTRHGTSSASNVSWIGSVQVFLLIAVGLPAGKLLDVGYFRITTAIGSTLFVFCLFMVSIADPTKYYQLMLAQGIGMGIGAGLLYVPALAIQAHHWRRHRAPVVGVVVAGSALGGVIFPIMLNNLINGSVGFAWGVRATAFLILGLLVIANLTMSTHPAVTSKKLEQGSFRTICADVPYLLHVFGGIIILWGLLFPYFYLQLFAIEKKIDRTVAFYSLVVLNGASIPGRILPNMLVGRFGVFNQFIPICWLFGTTLFALFGVHNVAGLICFAIFNGFFSGGIFSLFTLSIATLARNENEIGLRVGLGYAVVGLGALTGNPIDGALVGPTFTWSKAIIFSAVAAIGGTVFAIITRTLLAKRRGTRLV